MKLIRFPFADDYTPNLGNCLTRNEPDFLQLDFSRFPEQAESAPSKFAGGARSFWRDIHKALYLSTTLRVITNAGGGNVVAFMEELAEFLAEHGSADMPIAAIRGGNVVNSLDQILPADMLPKDHGLLAAQVEMGAGPIATALADGARIVVCGDYDAAAPFLAAGTKDGFCTWQDLRSLGALAAASQFEGLLVETLMDGNVKIESAATGQLSAIRRLGVIKHADLSCDYTNVNLTLYNENEILAGVEAEPTAGEWNLRLTSAQGCRVDALISTEGDQRAQLSRFCEQHAVQGTFNLRAYLPAQASVRDEYLMKISFHALALAECQQFLAAVKSFVWEHACGRIVEPRPTIETVQHTQWIPISRDELTLAVETRPAREWL